MNAVMKKIGIFVIVLFLLQLLFATTMTSVMSGLQIKTIKTISGSMAPAYPKGDIVFLKNSPYGIGDVVLYTPSSQEKILARIIVQNADGTFQVKGDANAAQLSSQKSIRAEQIEGKAIGHINFMLVYVVLNGLVLLITFVISKRLYAKLQL